MVILPPVGLYFDKLTLNANIQNHLPQPTWRVAWRHVWTCFGWITVEDYSLDPIPFPLNKIVIGWIPLAF